jgi:LysR family hydrogen peroxide-inducible transcriptional activator
MEEKTKEIAFGILNHICSVYSRKSSHLQKKEIEISDLNIDEILLLQDGHCFRDGILNPCKK